MLPEEVSPVKLPKVPAMVELPVTVMPPEETVKVVTVGPVAKTRFPVPVVPVTEERRLAAVMVETRFFEASVATNCEAVSPEKLMVPEEVMPATPLMTPLVTSQVLLFMSILSSPSPMVRVPVVVNVPEILLELMVPPERVIVSGI